MSADFEYLSELTEDFFRQRRVGRSLAIIEDQAITGWEVWFQIEFANFLSQHESLPEWWREWPVELDRRKEKGQTFCRPDFIIRKKGWRKESYAALEVKQHPDAAACFSNMMKDIKKISKVRVSSLDIRTSWVLGIHKRKSKTELQNLILSRFKSAGMEPPSDNLLIRYISGSNFAYSMF
ncbi:hypothetical protein [Marinospirillum alkaliphilum]|uniref:Uncharacterized protein n=1 Tax=Marinospirillum alkaliphilum DSM 21637 TaxID=1122209 RepID=A0A1K1W2I9_9GAMM|nr:hypothetical protein [Marinospirillum alkaliphilum]SFX31140.1 hypothetical protein SAMN02745752_01216 [Marinospirillum alkaliphilum DSM 21637]